MFGKFSFLKGHKDQIILMSNDEEYSLAVPNVEQGKVIVISLGDDNRSLLQGNAMGPFVISYVSSGKIYINRKFAAVVQQGMHLDCPFFGSESGPVKYRKAQADPGGAQQIDRRLDPEFDKFVRCLLS